MQINHHKAVEKAHKDGSAKSSIHIKPSEEGSLHTAMGVSQDKKISTAAEKKLVFALNAKKFKH